MKYPVKYKTTNSKEISDLKLEISLLSKERDILQQSLTSCENALNCANINIEIAEVTIKALTEFIHKIKM